MQNNTREGVQNNTTTPPKITPLTSTYLTKESKDCADENQHSPIFFSKGNINDLELLDTGNKKIIPCQENNENQQPPAFPSEEEKKEINARNFFLSEVKPLFLELLSKYRQVEYYAFDYVKEITVFKKWIKQVKEKQPDWGEEEIAPRLNAYIKRWFETHDNDPPSISRIFSSNSLNEYRFWVAKTHPGQINTSL